MNLLRFNDELLQKIALFYKKKVKCDHQPSRLMGAGVSARPLTLSRSAVLRKAGNCSWETFTSPAYINSKMACRWVYETSFRIIIGCFDGFSSNSDLKYGLQADNTILCALHVCPSHANVTSVKLFSSLKCLKEVTIFVWKSFHFRKNCWSAIIDTGISSWWSKNFQTNIQLLIENTRFNDKNCAMNLEFLEYLMRYYQNPQKLSVK